MTLLDLLAFAIVVVGFVGVFAAAANEAAAGLAGIFAAATTTPKAALAVTAAAGCCGLLVLNAGVAAGLLDKAMPLGGWGLDTSRLAICLFAATFATAAVCVAMLILALPAPILLVQVCAMVSVAAAAGQPASMSAILATAAALVGIVGLAAAVGYGCTWLVATRVLASRRPRDAAPIALAIAAGLTGGVSLAALLALSDMSTAPAWAVAAGIVIAALVPGAMAYANLRNRPFQVSNDGTGVEAAFRGLQLAGGAVAALAAGMLQVLALGFPILLALRLRQEQWAESWTELSPGADVTVLLVLLVGGGLGVLMAGHRVARWMGDRMMPTGPVGGCSANGGTLLGSLCLALAGLPVAGNQAAAGGLIGVGLAGGQTDRLVPAAGRVLAAWVLAPATGSVLALAVYGACRVLVG